MTQTVFKGRISSVFMFMLPLGDVSIALSLILITRSIIGNHYRINYMHCLELENKNFW